MSIWFFALAQFAVLAFAVVGGVFLAFSDFIMRSLFQTGGVGGIEAMQIINREVFRWIFMTLFLGLAPISIVIMGYSVVYIGGLAGALMALAGLMYLVGCFGVTVVLNVPMNKALASMDLSDSTTKDYWTRSYVPRWTFWNTVRTAACVISAALLLVGLLWTLQNQRV
ncbi:DUF1772 domain-containing protein [Aliiroseovarius sp. S1339]|uniref:anthrone oxygenase family protein n=1 Tax=Aliiroseovarius sp. S1339 TaxID=2936990 RepID=UPI0020BFF5B1|nr:anthrone oxygenase family protein [Aliiroseovarius sp. S1339]MCK8464812.1 DUF1772 domain-containing protein [Aliiroseovarius sp. S1339]